MESNYNRRPKANFCKNLRVSIHNTMSYTELIQNCVAVHNKLLPELPPIVQKLLVHMHSPIGNFGYMIDLSALKIIDPNNKYQPNQTYSTVVTTDLLDLYGVSSEQFIMDCFNNDILLMYPK